jgi:hypothetical protein
MADAPRMRAYLPAGLGGPVLHMPRSDWDSLGVSSTSSVLIDVTQTPMSAVARDASVVATYAKRFSSAAPTKVVVIRLDPVDDPDIYNMDKYEVFEDLQNHADYAHMAAAASTADDGNLREYLRENVFFVKRDHFDGHRLPELSASIRLLMNPSST